jgi:transcriptional regulator with XRE-family HTH domain
MPVRPKKPKLGRPTGSRSFDPLSAQVFGDVVRDARAASGLSQDALAHAADLDRTYLSKLERGINQPTLFAILKIAAALGFKASTLLISVQRRLDASLTAEQSRRPE